uniref:Uncharacterized protein n=1 Tax=Ditylenchus dipsaci TaxID=166011 RepID=A0A915ED02_9BILA
MPVFWQAPEEPLIWLKEVLERGVLDPEEAAHPIFAVDHKQEEIRSVVASFRRPKNAEHLSGSWKKTKEHFVQLSKSRKKLAVKNIQEKQFRPQKTDGSNDVPEKKSLPVRVPNQTFQLLLRREKA